MNAQNIFLNIKDVTCLTFVGQFFNNFMPTTIGGDVIKAHYASNVTKKRLETFLKKQKKPRQQLFLSMRLMLLLRKEKRFRGKLKEELSLNF